MIGLRKIEMSSTKNTLSDSKIKKLIRNLVLQSLPITSMKGLENKGFIPGKTPIQYAGPSWTSEEIEAAIYALLRGKWLSSGENVHKFEKEFSQVVGKKYCVMCNSGSSANLLMLAALKSKNVFSFEGVEVITPAVCFPTTVAPILQCGFTPKFIDVEMDTLNLDLDRFEEAITPKTKAVIFAHVLGNPPDMDRLMKICRSKKIILLEDACDALGSLWSGKPLGSFGLISSHSFYPAHHITTGEGGMVSTSNKNIAEVMRSIAWWGRACTCVGSANLSLKGTCGKRFSKWLRPEYEGILDHKYVYKEMGYNLKLLDMQGAIGLVQLKKLPRLKQARQRIFEKYYNICKEYPELIKIAGTHPKADVNWFGFPITVITDKFKRSDFVTFLGEKRIQTRNYFSGNILFHPPYAHLGSPFDYPNACRVMERTFFIGLQPNMSDKMIDFVRESLDEFLSRYQ